MAKFVRISESAAINLDQILYRRDELVWVDNHDITQGKHPRLSLAFPAITTDFDGNHDVTTLVLFGDERETLLELLHLMAPHYAATAATQED